MHICTFCEVIGGSSLRMTYEKCSLNIFEMTHNTNELMKSIVNLKLLIFQRLKKGILKKIKLCSFHRWNKHEITFPKVGH